MIKQILNLKSEILNLQSRGFTIVELLVVVSIVAVLSISSIVGFGHLGDVLRIREISGLVEDSLKHEELKILRGDLQKSTIHFLADYLVINEESEDELGILFDKTTCPDGHQIKFSTDEKDVNLKKLDGEGRTLEVKTVSDDGTLCVSFKESEEREWQYELASGDSVSNLIRFVHFNANRERLDNLATVGSGVGSRVEIKAPYAKRQYYDANGSPLSELTMAIQNDSDAEPEEIILK